MKRLEVFEPAMCCPTGVCGVDVDPLLVQFSADVQWLGENGVQVVRHDLAHAPAAFAANPAVLKEIEAGMDRLPIATVDGRMIAIGAYPSRAQLADALGLAGAGTGEGKPRIRVGACDCKPGEC